jgi:hypothetical protein
MRRLAAAAALLGAAALAAAFVARAGSGSVTAFRTPDAGAACRVEAQALVCSSLASPGSVALRARAGAEVVSRLPWWDASTPVVRRWSRGGITCRLAGQALLCSAGGTAVRVAGDGFAVAR